MSSPVARLVRSDLVLLTVATVAVLAEEVEHHVAIEESDMFDTARSSERFRLLMSRVRSPAFGRANQTKTSSMMRTAGLSVLSSHAVKRPIDPESAAASRSHPCGTSSAASHAASTSWCSGSVCSIARNFAAAIPIALATSVCLSPIALRRNLARAPSCSRIWRVSGAWTVICFSLTWASTELRSRLGGRNAAAHAPPPDELDESCGIIAEERNGYQVQNPNSGTQSAAGYDAGACLRREPRRHNQAAADEDQVRDRATGDHCACLTRGEAAEPFVRHLDGGHHYLRLDAAKRAKWEQVDTARATKDPSWNKVAEFVYQRTQDADDRADAGRHQGFCRSEPVQRVKGVDNDTHAAPRA